MNTYSETDFIKMLETVKPEVKDYILSDYVTDKIIQLYTNVFPENVQEKIGLIISFYLAGQITDDKLASVIQKELQTDENTANTYADAIIDEFTEDREVENVPSQTTKPSLAEELLHVAGDSRASKLPAHPNTTQVSPAPISTQNIETTKQDFSPTSLKPLTDTPRFEVPIKPIAASSKPLDAEIMDHFGKFPVVDPKAAQGRVENMNTGKTVAINPFSDQSTPPKEEKVIPDNSMPPIIKPVTIPEKAVVPPFEKQAQAEKTEPLHVEQEHSPAIDNANKTSDRMYKGSDPYREPIN